MTAKFEHGLLDRIVSRWPSAVTMRSRLATRSSLWRLRWRANRYADALAYSAIYVVTWCGCPASVPNALVVLTVQSVVVGRTAETW